MAKLVQQHEPIPASGRSYILESHATDLPPAAVLA